MSSEFFGSPPLFGVHHPPARTGAATDVAVLVCPSIGHEHTRAQRALRVAAQALARAGHHVLRFDYRGVGDSAGDATDGTIDAWCDDIRRALARLAAVAQARTFALVGLRVGATLAVQALTSTLDASVPVRRLVLWDPVVRGHDFLDVATALDAAFFSDPGRFPALRLAHQRGRATPAGDDLLGYRYPPALRGSLRALDLALIEPWPEVATTLLVSEPSPAGDDLVVKLRAAGRSASIELVPDAEGAWSDYARHELALRAGRFASFLVASLKASAGPWS